MLKEVVKHAKGENKNQTKGREKGLSEKRACSREEEMKETKGV